MRLATFNILNGRSPEDGRVDLDRFQQVVAELDADVLALQEVDRGQPRSGGADLAALAAGAAGADEHRFVAALRGTPGTWTAATGADPPGGPAYGIALLSRYPVRSWRVFRLPPVPVRVPFRFPGSRGPALVRDEPRVGVAAEVETPLGTMTVANTHLSFLRWSNGRQLRRLVRGLEQATRPLLLLGDLNMGPQRAETISGMRPMASHLTFPWDTPREQLDHILLAGSLAAHTSSEVLRLAVSDHRALVLDLGTRC